MSQTRDCVTSYFHYDAQVSTRALTDENQNVTDTFTYTAFGVTVERSGVSKTPYHFQGAYGHQSDGETGHIYVRRRMQDAGFWILKMLDGFRRIQSGFETVLIGINISEINHYR